MLTLITPRGRRALLQTARARDAIVSWNSREDHGRIELAIHRSDGQVSTWLPYVEWTARERRSLSGQDDIASLDIDMVRSPRDIVAIEVRSDAELDAVAATTPRHPALRKGRLTRGKILNVPARSQYLGQAPDDRGWCSPAATGMLLQYWGYDYDVATIAKGVRDDAYGGTGNWAFNVAFAGALGLRALVVYVRDLLHAAAFIEAGMPLAVSYAWKAGELPHAPLEASAGHFGVLCGFDDAGDCIVNDPAVTAVNVTYPRAAFERAWIEHGGIAYAAAPPEQGDSLVRLANG